MSEGEITVALKRLIVLANKPVFNEIRIDSGDYLGKCFVCKKKTFDDSKKRILPSINAPHLKEVLVCSEECGFEYYKFFQKELIHKIDIKESLFDKTIGSISKLELLNK